VNVEQVPYFLYTEALQRLSRPYAGPVFKKLVVQDNVGILEKRKGEQDLIYSAMTWSNVKGGGLGEAVEIGGVDIAQPV